MPARQPVLAWVQPLDAAADDLLRHALAGAGFDVRVVAPGQPLPEEADLRVLPLSALLDREEIVNELERDPCPTLLLADDEAQDQLADELVARRPQDDVELRHTPSASLVRRLHRLHARSVAAGPDLRTRDPLTGLLSRPAFEAAAQPILAGLTPDRPAALILIDLDHFAAVNDRQGHVAGDAALAEVAQRLIRAAMPGDLIARFGGDGFVLLARRDQRELLWMLAEMAREAVAGSPCALPGRPPMTLTASAGMTYLSPDLSLAEAEADAQRALATAKAAGRQRTLTHVSVRRAIEATPDIGIDGSRSKAVSARAAELIAQAGFRLLDASRQRIDEDPLTGAWTRNYFDRRLQREFMLAHRDHRPLSLALLDIDHFGPFNDSHGQPTGDIVLRRVVELARGCIRSVDWVSRFDGESFALVTPGDAQEAVAVAERIREEISRADIPTLSGEAVQVTVSVGVAGFDDSIGQPLELVDRAVAALLNAKTTGRNRVSLHEQV